MCGKFVFIFSDGISFSFSSRNELRKVPGQAQVFTAKKQYLHATKTLIQGLELANGPLSPIEGLNELRGDLQLRVQQLYMKLIDELNRHLYQHSTAESLTNFHRHGSTRNSNLSTPLPHSSATTAASPFQRSGMRRSAERAEANQKMRKVLFELSQSGFDLNKTELIEDTDLLDADASFFIIVECFSLLKRVPDSLDVSAMFG